MLREREVFVERAPRLFKKFFGLEIFCEQNKCNASVVISITFHR